jgi:CYTH domain-containing protein
MSKQIEQEIERRFLILGIPNINYEQIIRIEQCYREDIPERVRKSEFFLKSRKPYFNFWMSEKSRMHFEKTLKESIPGKEGVQETNEELNEAKYIELKSKFPNHIKKIRHVKECKQNQGLKWEIDDFSCHNTEEVNLLIAEIEVPSMDYNLQMPGWLKSHVLIEVTNQKEFSNFNISKLLNTQKKQITR